MMVPIVEVELWKVQKELELGYGPGPEGTGEDFKKRPWSLFSSSENKFIILGRSQSLNSLKTH